MTERLFDLDPLTGLKTTFRYNEADDSFALTYSQDVAPVLDACKEAQTESFDRRSELWHAATIPAGVQLEWLVKHGVDLHNKNHREGVRRLLNSNEYRYLRVRNFII